MPSRAELRHYCRNPRCRMRLKAPVESQHRAFCSRGCYEQFFQTRCLVCERDIQTDPMTGAKRRSSRFSHRRFCGKKCKNEKARFPHTFAWLSASEVAQSQKRAAALENAHKTGGLIGPQDWPIMLIGPRLPNHRSFPNAPTVLAVELWRLRGLNEEAATAEATA